MNSNDNNDKQKLIEQAQEEFLAGRLSRRDFNSILLGLGVVAGGLSLLVPQTAKAWVATRMRKPRSSGGVAPTDVSLRMGIGYLSRTGTVAAPTDATKMTFSFWVKKVAFGANQMIFNTAYDTNNFFQIYFNSSDTISVASKYAGGNSISAITSAPCKDPTAWYHVVVSLDTSQSVSACKIWLNGVRQALGTDSVTVNAPTVVLFNNVIYNTVIGMNYLNSAEYFTGYLAEFHYVDGQVLTPGSFASADPTTGQWLPVTYAGTFGNAGFRLKFADNSATSSTTMGKDIGGNSQNFNPISFNTYDQVLDSPMNNFCIINTMATWQMVYGGINQSGYRCYGTTAAGPPYNYAYGTMHFTTGKYYYEVTSYSNGGYGCATIGIGVNGTNYYPRYIGNGGDAGFGSYGTYGMAIDADAGKAWFTNVAGVFSGNPVTGTSPDITFTPNGVISFFISTTRTSGFNNYGVGDYNWGIGLQAGMTYNAAAVGRFMYTPPTGYKSLSTYNLPTQAVPYAASYFKAYTYTGIGGGFNVGTALTSSSSYHVTKSLRFRSGVPAYMYRTPATQTGQKTWTWSCWIKRGSIGGGGQCLIEAASGATPYTTIMFNSSNQLFIGQDDGGGGVYNLTTSSGFSDVSAWYHIVFAMDTTQATAANRCKIYVNGSQITAFASASYPPLNYATWMHNPVPHRIGNRVGSSYPYDGLMCEAYLLDGYQLDATAFGQTDPTSSRWVPKTFSGAYGTNGFYLKMSDSTSTATLGTDSSGNGNTFTTTGFTLTAGLTYDSFIDVPTDYNDGGTNRGSYCVLSQQDQISCSITNGNLSTYSGNGYGRGTMAMTTGKWYWETYINGGSYNHVGLKAPDTSVSGGDNNFRLVYRNDGAMFKNAGTLTGTSSFTAGDTIAIAYDADKLQAAIYKNNTLVGTYAVDYTPAGYSAYFLMTTATETVNFGQQPFTYTPPTGYKALNSYNMSSLVTSAMKPDLVWIKDRTDAYNHVLYDSARGAKYEMYSNLTTASTLVDNGLTSFNGGGFSLGDSLPVNRSASKFVAWTWKKGGSPGFDVVSYTGTGTSSQLISHSAGKAPAFMIVKCTTAASSWSVYHQNMTTVPANGCLFLDTTAAYTPDAARWNSVAPSATQISVGTNLNSVNNYVAYVFAEISGFSRMGSYTGSGTADGPFVWCGFRPAFVMIKQVDSTGDWTVFDSARSPKYGDMAELYPYLTNADGITPSYRESLYATGFKIESAMAYLNASGGTYIFVAFAEAPLKYARAR